MSEAVQFWLENKMSTGIRVAGIGDQSLVLYRDRYYLVEKGAARMGGRKPLRYSKSSLPPIWKKALSAETAQDDADLEPSPPEPALADGKAQERMAGDMSLPAPLMREEPSRPEPVHPPLPLPSTRVPKPPRKGVKLEKAPAHQTNVVVRCPYCSNEHELEPEKGKVGKSFFLECERCKTEFAVRIVPVMIYQAIVAGFRQQN